MVKKLDCFDFDGTLVNTPTNTVENQKLYEKATGIPWLIDKNMSVQLSAKLKKHVPMRRGWWGRPETLEPPLVPNPTPKNLFSQPVVKLFLASKADENTITLMLTGRHAGLKPQVLRILKDGELVKIQQKGAWYDVIDHQVFCHFLGENGPIADRPNKPGETFPWKSWIIEQYLDLNADIETVEIWEDRAEHVVSFKGLAEVFPQTFVVNHVTMT